MKKHKKTKNKKNNVVDLVAAAETFLKERGISEDEIPYTTARDLRLPYSDVCLNCGDCVHEPDVMDVLRGEITCKNCLATLKCNKTKKRLIQEMAEDIEELRFSVELIKQGMRHITNVQKTFI